MMSEASFNSELSTCQLGVMDEQELLGMLREIQDMKMARKARTEIINKLIFLTPVYTFILIIIYVQEH